MGRPSIYTPELANEICERMSLGESLLKICRDVNMPDASTVYRWADKDEEFCKQYTRARKDLVDVYAQEVIDIADEPPTLVFRDVTADGKENTVISVDHAAVAYQRHRTDSRKWYASKIAPKLYGDRITHQGDKDNPIEFNVTSSKVLEDKLKGLASKYEGDD